MTSKAFAALIAAALGLAACGSGGNIHTAKDYDAPPPPPIRHPGYNPYAAYGEANATWRPPVFDRDGTIQKPVEPSSQYLRPDYEHAPWATGASPSPYGGPPGTF